MIFPDSDNVFTLQMLSTNTIVISLTPKIFNTNAATLIGMHVPGPLQRIKSGFSCNTTGNEKFKAFKVVKIEESHD